MALNPRVEASLLLLGRMECIFDCGKDAAHARLIGLSVAIG
jgi:hypothetical protein